MRLSSEEDKVANLVDRVDRHDVGVRELGRRARLTDKALPECRLGRELGGQELQRHGPVERDLVREVDDPHPAAADLPLEGVPSDERLLKGEKVGIRGVTHSCHDGSTPGVRQAKCGRDAERTVDEGRGPGEI